MRRIDLGRGYVVKGVTRLRNAIKFRRGTPADAPPQVEATDDESPSEHDAAHGGRPNRNPFVTAWSWLTKQAAPVQALLALLALFVALIPFLPHGKKDPTPPKPSPSQSYIYEPGRALLVSSNSRGQAGNNDSGRPTVSGDGRYVAFTSAASNLTNLGAGNHYNIYRKDLVTGGIDLVSTTPDDKFSDGDSQFPSICRSGRYVAFGSDATNLSSNGFRTTAKRWHIYVRDMLSGTTTLISLDQTQHEGAGDSFAPSLSADCGTIAFESLAGLLAGAPSGLNQIYIAHPASHRLELASTDSHGKLIPGESFAADISPTGKMVAFNTYRGGAYQVFVKNLQSGEIKELSRPFTAPSADRAGFAWPNFSPDGRYVSFRSMRPDKDPKLVGDATVPGSGIFVWDLKENRSGVRGIANEPIGWKDACVDGVSNGTRFAPGMSGGVNGSPYRIVFPVGKAPDCHLIFRDLQGTSVAVDLGDQQSEIIEPTVNAEGMVMAWATSTNHLQVYVCLLDRTGGATNAVNSCRR